MDPRQQQRPWTPTPLPPPTGLRPTPPPQFQTPFPQPPGIGMRPVQPPGHVQPIHRPPGFPPAPRAPGPQSMQPPPPGYAPMGMTQVHLNSTSLTKHLF